MSTQTVQIVYSNISADLRKDIISMWVNTGALTLEQARTRVYEVVAVNFEENRLIGVTTVYKSYYKDQPYFFLRVFKKTVRNVAFFPRNKEGILKATFNFLKENNEGMEGIVCIAENTRITPQMMSFFGYELDGTTPLGQLIFKQDF
jgi:hypothetical protein